MKISEDQKHNLKKIKKNEKKNKNRKRIKIKQSWISMINKS